MRNRNRNATLWVVLCTALLSAALPAKALVPVVGIDGVFEIFNEKSAPAGFVTVDVAWEDVYAMDMAVGTPPLPAGKGKAVVTLTLSVTDPALDERMRQWRDAFSFMDDHGEFTPIAKGVDGRFRLSIDLYGVRPGLVRIPVFYRFRASRDHSGFRPLGLKITLDSKAGAGAGATGICLYVVEPPEGLFDGQIDREAVLNWAQRLHNRGVNGTELAAAGGLRPLFTMRPVNEPDPAVQAFIQQQIAAIEAQAQVDVELAVKTVGEEATSRLRAEYQPQLDAALADAVRAKGDATAAQAALVAANEALAAMAAQAEKWAAERDAERQRMVVQTPPSIPVVQVVEACPAPPPWTWLREGTILSIVANINGVLVKVCYGKGFKLVPDATLCTGGSARIDVTPLRTEVEVSIAVDGGGRLTRTYGHCGPTN